MAPRLLRRALVGTSALLCTSALVLAPALAAAAIDIDVDDDGAGITTIQDALAIATSGDVINVAAGSYTGPIAVTVPVEIRGAGAASTVITGTVTVTAETEITGFTIRGQAAPASTSAPYAPSAIQLYAGAEGSSIHDNVLTNGYHGVYIEGVDAAPANPTVVADNQILDIHADQGNGVWVSNSSHVEVTGNTFENVDADPNAVGVNLVCNSTDVFIDGNEFTNLGNAIVAIAAGTCGPISNVTISHNVVDGFAGSGAFYFGGNNISGVRLRDNTVANTTNAAGAIVKFSDLAFFAGTGAAPLSDIVIEGNTFSNAPYGVLVQAGVQADADGVEVTDNTMCDISIEEIENLADPDAVYAAGNIFVCGLPTLADPGTSGGGSASGQLDTLAVTGSEPSVAALGIAALLAAVGVVLVVRARRLGDPARHRRS